MRKLLFILLLCITTSAFGQFFAPNQKPCLGLQVNWAHPLSQGLVGCWLFNEGSGGQVFDLSGNGNTGTLIGTAHFGSGKFGSGLVLDGDSDYVDLADLMSGMKYTQGTVFVWVKADAITGTHWIYTNHKDSAWDDRIYLGVYDDSGTDKIIVRLGTSAETYVSTFQQIHGIF